MDLPLSDPDFGKAVPCQCRQSVWEGQRWVVLRRFSCLEAFTDKILGSFKQYCPAVREAHVVACAYAQDPSGWLVFLGGYGCGKTHLAAAIANEFLASHQPVYFAVVPDLLDHLRATFDPSSSMKYDDLFERIKEVALLVLDDLGVEMSTPWATEKLFQLLNYRYNYRLPTVITTNHRMLRALDERLASRLSDRALVRTVLIEAPDYRRRAHSAELVSARKESHPGEVVERNLRHAK